MARVFSQKHSLTFVGNAGIYSVGTESVYQIVQTGRTKCLVGVSRKGLTREILARHNCLHLVPTLRILVMCKAHALLLGKLSCKILAKTSSIFNSLCLHTFSLYHRTLTIKSHNKYRVQKIEYNYN